MSALNQDQPGAWAVWIGDGDGRTQDIVAVKADSQDEAEEKALAESDYDEVEGIDGPFPDSDPAYFEFEFVTEHRERVVVEAPNRDYAEETAQRERDYRGEYVQTIHTDVRRVEKDG